MPDFDLTGELSLKIELHMLRPITEKVHSGNGPVSLVHLIKCKICYMNGFEWVHFSKFSQTWLKFKKILEKSGDFAQSLAQNWADWYINGSLFLLEKLVYLHGSTFKFCGNMSLLKPNLSTPTCKHVVKFWSVLCIHYPYHGWV